MMPGKTLKGWCEIGKAIELTRGGLHRLEQQVKAAEAIFQQAARRGDVFAGRSLIEFYAASTRSPRNSKR
jgi:hypothetical protein